MDISTDGKKWIRPTISHTFILTEFKYQVEENNYGKDGKIKRGGEGGEYLMRHIRYAIEDGWEKVAELVRKQVANKK